jgi:hypothetical protein
MDIDEASLRDRLAKLNGSQQSIENNSSWLVFYRKDARKVVDTWEDVFAGAPTEKRLAMLYLANDVIQNRCEKCMSTRPSPPPKQPACRLPTRASCSRPA